MGEVEELREQLQHMEKALREAQADVRQMEQSGYRRHSSREPHGYEAPRGASHPSRSREPHDSEASRARSHSQPRERNSHVGGVEASTIGSLGTGAHGGSSGSKARGSSSRGFDRTPSSASIRSSSHQGQAASQLPTGREHERDCDRHDHRDHRSHCDHGDHRRAIEVEGAVKNGSTGDGTEQSVGELEGENGRSFKKASNFADAQASASEDATGVSQLDGTSQLPDSKVHVSASNSRDVGFARVDVPYWNSASAHLFDMIERAKERADQRRLLSSAAEEVKARASALEELLDREAFVEDVNEPGKA